MREISNAIVRCFLGGQAGKLRNARIPSIRADNEIRFNMQLGSAFPSGRHAADSLLIDEQFVSRESGQEIDTRCLRSRLSQHRIENSSADVVTEGGSANRLLGGSNDPSPPGEGFDIVSHAAGFLDFPGESEPFQGRGGACLDEMRAELLVACRIAITFDQGDAGASAAEKYRGSAPRNTRSDDCHIVLRP